MLPLQSSPQRGEYGHRRDEGDEQEVVRPEEQPRRHRAGKAGERGHMRGELLPLIDEDDHEEGGHGKIDAGEIHFDKPGVLAEIVLIVLTVKMDNTIIPSSREEIEETIAGLVSLVEKGTDNPPGSLNFLMA